MIFRVIFWPTPAGIVFRVITLAKRSFRAWREAALSLKLLDLPDDALRIIGDEICNPLKPATALALAVSCRKFWGIMKVSPGDAEPSIMAKLKDEYDGLHSLAELAEKAETSCAAMREAMELDLSDRGLRPRHMRALGSLLSSGAPPMMVDVLDLSLNGDGVWPWPLTSALCNGLVHGAAPNLHSLELEFIGMGLEGASALSNALTRGALPVLRDLGLGDNELGDEGMIQLAGPLRRRPALTFLNLEKNKISDRGLAALVDNLDEHELKNLEELLLHENRVPDAGCALLVAAIESGALPGLARMARSCKDLNDKGGLSVFDNPASQAAQGNVGEAIASRQ